MFIFLHSWSRSQSVMENSSGLLKTFFQISSIISYKKISTDSLAARNSKEIVRFSIIFKSEDSLRLRFKLC